MYFFFFFQAEDGIRDLIVTGVQTCALPISTRVTSTPGIRASSRATQQPTIPAPTTATRSPSSGPASQSALTAVSTVPASTARRAGTPSGTTVTAVAGTTYAVWWGYRQNTVRPTRSSGPRPTTPTLR